VSALPAEDLVAILVGRAVSDDASGRWVQENGFKHGVARWGINRINQLDGRKVELYPPGTIIANKRRRRIERALAIARADEGRGRCALAALKPTDEKKRTRVETDLADSIHRRIHLELMRPLVQKHAPVEDTELAGKLVRHTGELKAVVDTIRVVAANVEADLAEMIAPHLRRPSEAKGYRESVRSTRPRRCDHTRGPCPPRDRRQPVRASRDPDPACPRHCDATHAARRRSSPSASPRTPTLMTSAEGTLAERAVPRFPCKQIRYSIVPDDRATTTESGLATDAVTTLRKCDTR
jgi:hypothetical protein